MDGESALVKADVEGHKLSRRRVPGRFDEFWPLPCRRTEKCTYAIEKFELWTNPRRADPALGPARLALGGSDAAMAVR
jgi:hypothetical protein